MNEHVIRVKTITDQALESFMRCPVKFYHQSFVAQKEAPNWRQYIQAVVNKIVKQYYQLSHEERSCTAILKLVHTYWQSVDVSLFESKSHYYEVLAKVSDYLMTFLAEEKKVPQPLFLQEKFHTYVEPLDVHLAVHFEVVEWSDRSFIVKKFLIEDNPSFIHIFKQLVTVFSKHAFGKVPEEIHIYSLMNGNHHQLLSGQINYDYALNDLSMMKDILGDYSSYQASQVGSHCVSCPVRYSCLEEDTSNIDRPFFYM